MNLTRGLVLLLCSAAAGAQGQSPRILGDFRRVAEGFSEITAVRELSDGRVLVLDGREQALTLIDPQTGARRTVGRVGSGPGEYRRATGLLRGRGDTTYLTDAGNGRLLVIAPDGSTPGVVRQWPERGMTIWVGSGADAAGGIYGTVSLAAPDADPTTPPDSQGLARAEVTTGVLRRVATLAAPPSRINVRRTGERIDAVEVIRPPFAVGDQFGVAADGRVAIARRSPYRLDIVRPTGDVIRGAPIPFEPVRVGAAEREAHLATLGPPARARADAIEWPETLPPFPPRAVLALANGQAWVRRHAGAAAPGTTYDVFDAAARRTGQVRLPGARHLLAITPRGAWIAMTDDDGLQQLEHTTQVRDRP